MSDVNPDIVPGQPHHNEPQSHPTPDIVDFVDETAEQITDADIEERLQETLRKTGYQHSQPRPSNIAGFAAGSERRVLGGAELSERLLKENATSVGRSQVNTSAASVAERNSTKVAGKYPSTLTRLDPSVPNIARIYDYYLGGRENFRSDRDAAQLLERLIPGVGTAARDIRAFRHRAVRFLSQQGISQFLDIGSGMPGMPGTTATPETSTVLDTAQQVNPEARVAYVDNDPVVVSHGGALLAKSAGAIMIQADLRDPGWLLSHPSLRRHLDFGQPVGMLLVSVLDYVDDDDDPAGIVAALRDALAPGSYVVLDHITHEHVDRRRVQGVLATYDRASATMNPRSAERIRGLFDGFELVEPGLVDPAAWRPENGEVPERESSLSLSAVARKT